MPLLVSLFSVLLVILLGLAYWKRDYIKSRYLAFRGQKEPSFVTMESNSVQESARSGQPASSPSEWFDATSSPQISHNSDQEFRIPSPVLMTHQIPFVYGTSNFVMETQVVYDQSTLTRFDGFAHDKLNGTPPSTQGSPQEEHHSPLSPTEPLMLMPMYVDTMGRCFMMYDGANLSHTDVQGSFSEVGHHSAELAIPSVSSSSPDTVQTTLASTPKQEITEVDHVRNEDTPPNDKENNSEPYEVVNVVQEYIPSLPDELPLEVGLSVHVLHVYQDGWAMGRYVSKGETRMGVFPLCFTSSTTLDGSIQPSLAKRNQSLKKTQY
jgi:hypothetical protein